jgi:moderate conductance mechanosensitive channel
MSSKKIVTTITVVLLFIFGLTLTAVPVKAQLPFVQDLLIYSKAIRQLQENSLQYACIQLDGRCLFKLASTESEKLSTRIDEIQTRFDKLTEIYLNTADSKAVVTIEPNNNLRDIGLRISDLQERKIYTQERLFTVTTRDADDFDVSLDVRAEQIQNAIESGLETAKKEREPKYLLKQSFIAIAILFGMFMLNFPLNRWIDHFCKSTRLLAPSDSSQSLPIDTQLNRRQQWNLKEIQYRLLQLLQVAMWGWGLWHILNLFPHTRILSFLSLAFLRIPFQIAIISTATYLVIRLTYFLIAKISSLLLESQTTDVKINQRGKLRVTTTTKIIRGVFTALLSGIGILVACSITGVNITPILAGAGIFGLAISLASQNLIKDAIQGFFIIWDDRYAVGDVVEIGQVSGLVENINLRITQLRDAQGKLITIPNSAVDIVCNNSSQWSRADLNIPVGYSADLDRALAVITQVATDIAEDDRWQELIWSAPQILGVEEFSDRGIIIRVWIETEPLKQWEVAREFRRRIKIAFDREGIPIPDPQQQILFDRRLSNIGDIN